MIFMTKYLILFYFLLLNFFLLVKKIFFNKNLAFFYILALSFTFLNYTAFANPRYSSIILEESSGKVLFSRNADKKLYPASLTKIMTLYLIFEALQQKKISLNSSMKVSKVAASRSPSILYLRKGQNITVKNAILALITKSANDVATVVAEHLSGTERNFARKMTRKAKALGMNNTIFKNASGLPNRSQFSTARDMSKLAIAIRKDFPDFYPYFSRTSFNWKGHKFRNHNKLLSSFNGTDGIKTGYTSASGFNLVTSAERMGVRLIGVVFGGKSGNSRDKHMINLLNRQFKKIKSIPVKMSPSPQTPLSRPRVPVNLNISNLPTFPKSRPISISSNLSNIMTLKSSIKKTKWSIQIGSFSRRIAAHKAAISARRLANNVLDLTPAQLTLVMTGNIPLWKVRFDELNEEQARNACAVLFTSGKSCITIPQNLIDKS